MYYFGKETVYSRFADRIKQLSDIKNWTNDGNYVANIVGNQNSYH